MKIIFAGTPIFAARALQAIINAGFTIPLVLTQPDRPAGRGMKLTASAVKQIALQHNITIAQPTSLKLDGKYPEQAQATRQAISEVNADVMVVAAYGLILPLDILQTPKHGCINIHASLLPRWRGAAPIHRAIQAGDTQTGITLMQMDVGLDTGYILNTRTIAIGQHNQASLHDALAQMGADMIVDYLHDIQNGEKPLALKQPLDGISYAEKINKDESRLNWHESATILERKIRAFNPSPATWIPLNDNQSMKIYAAQVLDATDHPHIPGTILNVGKNGIDVACRHGILRITEIQRAGGKRLLVAQGIDGLPLVNGQVLL